MITLLLALTLLFPPKKTEPQQAWEDEILCWSDGPCGPRVVNLGEWMPRPAEKDWPKSAYPAPSAGNSASYPYEPR